VGGVQVTIIWKGESGKKGHCPTWVPHPVWSTQCADPAGVCMAGVRRACSSLVVTRPECLVNRDLV
jgi:hypothetical protein